MLSFTPIESNLAPVQAKPLNHTRREKIIEVCLIWHSVYSANMGVNALTYTTLRYLEEVAEQLQICFDYTILGRGVRAEDRSIDEIVIDNKRISFTFEKLNIPNKLDRLGLDSLRISSKWLFSEFRPYIKKLAQYDLVLDMGEGDSFTDIYGPTRFIQLSLTKVLTLMAGTPLVLLPQTIGPFNHFPSRIIANQLLKRIPYVYPRDQTSLRYLENSIQARSFREYLDVAFYLPYQQYHFTPAKTHVGINVSALLWHGGYTKDNMFNLQADYQRIIFDIIRSFVNRKDVEVHLIPHVVFSGKLLTEDDYTVAEKIHQDIPETVLAPGFESPVEAKSYISGLDYFLGARMHSCIAAYSTGVPVIPMAYSRKFSGLFLSSLGYPVMVDLQYDDHQTVLQKVLNGFENRHLLRQAILDKKSMVEDNITAFRRTLTEIIKEAVL